MDYRKLARGLGWFSIGLGAIEILAPGKLQKMLGLSPDGKARVRSAYGAREVAAGAGLLTQDKKAPFLWSRVLGDALDLVTLIAAMKKSSKKKMVGFSIMNVLAVTMLDLIASTRATADERADLGARRVAVAQA